MSCNINNKSLSEISDMYANISFDEFIKGFKICNSTTDKNKGWGIQLSNNSQIKLYSTYKDYAPMSKLVYFYNEELNITIALTGYMDKNNEQTSDIEILFKIGEHIFYDRVDKTTTLYDCYIKLYEVFCNLAKNSYYYDYKYEVNYEKNHYDERTDIISTFHIQYRHLNDEIIYNGTYKLMSYNMLNSLIRTHYDNTFNLINSELISSLFLKLICDKITVIHYNYGNSKYIKGFYLNENNDRVFINIHDKHKSWTVIGLPIVFSDSDIIIYELNINQFIAFIYDRLDYKVYSIDKMLHNYTNNFRNVREDLLDKLFDSYMQILNMRYYNSDVINMTMTDEYCTVSLSDFVKKYAKNYCRGGILEACNTYLGTKYNVETDYLIPDNPVSTELLISSDVKIECLYSDLLTLSNKRKEVREYMKNIYDMWNDICRNHIAFIKSNNYTIKYVKELYDNLFKDESVSRNIDNG